MTAQHEAPVGRMRNVSILCAERDFDHLIPTTAARGAERHR
jgi:hypothetical protein